MARVKRGTTTHARHKSVIDQSKGFVGRSGTNYRAARERLEKSLQYAYRDRKVRKRTFRYLWQARINAATRAAGLTYSRFIEGLKAAQVAVDRKILADLAATDAPAFAEMVKRTGVPSATLLPPASVTVAVIVLPVAVAATFDGKPGIASDVVAFAIVVETFCAVTEILPAASELYPHTVALIQPEAAVPPGEGTLVAALT